MKRKIEMSEIPIGIAASEGVVLAVLTHLKNGKIDDAIARFAEEFRFKDHGIGLQFKHKETLRSKRDRFTRLGVRPFSRSSDPEGDWKLQRRI